MSQDFYGRAGTRRPGRVLHKDGGAPMKAFRDLRRRPAQTVPLSHKQKELIALAIAIAIRCDGCIIFHTRSCVKLGSPAPGDRRDDRRRGSRPAVLLLPPAAGGAR